MAKKSGALMWFRRDLRLNDNDALAAAIATGGPVTPVFILDPETEAFGGSAPRWRLSQSIRALARSIDRLGGRLILRRGDALETLRALIAETGAGTVCWTRSYQPETIDRDKRVKAALKQDGVVCESFAGQLLIEPFAVATGSGGFYKVYTPFWKAVKGEIDPGDLPSAPAAWPPPEAWPDSETVDALGLERGMNRGAAIVARHASVGEIAARDRLDQFLETGLRGYAENRDRLDLAGTSRLSENLATGEIGPRTVWRAVRAAAGRLEAEPDAETFLKEIVWREFAYHLLFHTPEIAERNWRSDWDAFPWRGDNEHAERWRRGRTGVPVVDAAMRELYVTGTMHNRARMLVASYLTKNLLTDWRVGEAWFRECLIDYDPASNAMGWQWAAGSGPDAAPFFRIFNPETQAEKFDHGGAYVARWLAEAAAPPHRTDEALSFFDACPRSWTLTPDDAYPEPALSLKAGRERALDAYESLKSN